MKYLSVLVMGLLLAACMTSKNFVPVPVEVQEHVEERIKDRNYLIQFVKPCVGFFRRGLIWGNMRIQQDSLCLWLWHPVFTIQGTMYRIVDYRQTRTENGVTEIDFAIERPEKFCYKKQDKNKPLPFRLKIYTTNRIDISIDGEDIYKGTFENKYLPSKDIIYGSINTIMTRMKVT